MKTGACSIERPIRIRCRKSTKQINHYETRPGPCQKFEHVEELYRWPLFPSLGLLEWGVILQQTRFAGYREVQRSKLAAGRAATCIVLIAMWRRYDVRQQTALAEFVAPHLRQRLTASVSKVGRSVHEACSQPPSMLFRGARGPARISLGKNQPPRQRGRLRDRHVAQYV